MRRCARARRYRTRPSNRAVRRNPDTRLLGAPLPSFSRGRKKRERRATPRAQANNWGPRSFGYAPSDKQNDINAARQRGGTTAMDQFALSVERWSRRESPSSRERLRAAGRVGERICASRGGGCFNRALNLPFPPPLTPPHRSQALAGGGERRERAEQLLLPRYHRLHDPLMDRGRDLLVVLLVHHHVAVALDADLTEPQERRLDARLLQKLHRAMVVGR